MTNMAGFDVIGQLSLDTVCDLIDQQTLPSAGDQIYLFGGPFFLTLGSGSGQSQCVCTASAQAIPQSQTCNLILDLRELSFTINGVSLYGLNGTATIAVTTDFVADPSKGAPANAVVPALLLNFAVAKVKLAAASCSYVTSLAGGTACRQIEQGLGYGLTSWVQSLGAIAITVFRFLVVPGHDSNDPKTLSARPRTMWIDATTLGVFGYYRAANQWGNPINKRDSDIVQSGQEFVYGQNGPVSVLPARRLALMLSPDGFHLAVACPAIRQAVIRSALRDLDKKAYQDHVRTTDWSRLYAQAFSQSFGAYYSANLAKEGSEAAAADAIAEVKADTEVLVEAEADQELDTWLSTSDGQAAIAAATPPGCGTSRIEVHREHMADRFGDMVTYLTGFNIDLAVGALAIGVEAKGNLPVCGGYTVTQSARLTLGVDALSRVFSALDLHDPSVDISPDPACEVVLAAVVAFFGGAAWGALVGFGGLSLVATIADGLAAKVMFAREQDALAGQPGGPFGLPLPSNMELKDIQIDPTALKLVGLFARDYHVNTFRPSLTVSAKLTAHRPARPSESGSMHVDRTRWGCPAADFEYSHGFWNSTFALTATPVDLVLPITIESWGIEIGNYFYLLPGVRDPRPTWSGAPVPIAAPQTTLWGVTFHPVPPTAGTLETRDNILVGATGDPTSGWQLQFRAEDGCFLVRVTVFAKAGDGGTYTGTTWFAVAGESVTFGLDYSAYVKACSDKHEKWLEAELHQVLPSTRPQDLPPGVPVEGSVESAVAQIVQEAVAAKSSAAYALARSAAARYGPRILNVGTPPARE